MKSSYRAIVYPVQHLFEEKRSTFTAFLYPVISREEAMALLRDVRLAHPGAGHYCWAYIIGDVDQPDAAAFNDDGEPSGTAGKPMLNVLTHRDAGNCLAVVARVFGGIKLGAGGLVRAYSSAVSEALDYADWQDVVAAVEVLIEIPFAEEQRVRHLLASFSLVPAEVNYSSHVSLVVKVPEHQYRDLSEQITAHTAGSAVIKIKEDLC